MLSSESKEVDVDRSESENSLERPEVNNENYMEIAKDIAQAIRESFSNLEKATLKKLNKIMDNFLDKLIFLDMSKVAFFLVVMAILIPAGYAAMASEGASGKRGKFDITSILDKANEGVSKRREAFIKEHGLNDSTWTRIDLINNKYKELWGKVITRDGQKAIQIIGYSEQDDYKLNVGPDGNQAGMGRVIWNYEFLEREHNEILRLKTMTKDFKEATKTGGTKFEGQSNQVEEFKSMLYKAAEDR